VKRFERLVYPQGASIRYERVKASNSCAGILIFGPSFLLSSVKVFFPTLFSFFGLTFYCLFSFCRINFFLSSFVFPPFSILFYSCFLAHVVSSLAYPTCLGLKCWVVVVVVPVSILKKTI
jgi:hypothetical protein